MKVIETEKYPILFVNLDDISETIWGNYKVDLEDTATDKTMYNNLTLMYNCILTSLHLDSKHRVLIDYVIDEPERVLPKDVLNIMKLLQKENTQFILVIEDINDSNNLIASIASSTINML